MMSGGQAESRRRILTYLTERLHHYRQVVNYHHLSLDTINRVPPAFKALYQSVLEREIAFIEQILERGIQAGEIRDCHAGRQMVRLAVQRTAPQV